MSSNRGVIFGVSQLHCNPNLPVIEDAYQRYLPRRASVSTVEPHHGTAQIKFGQGSAVAHLPGRFADDREPVVRKCDTMNGRFPNGSRRCKSRRGERIVPLPPV